MISDSTPESVQLHEEVVRRRFTERQPYNRICRDLGITLTDARSIVRQAVQTRKAGCGEIIDAAFHEQNELLDLLIAKCVAMLLRQFDGTVMRCLVLLLDRQAKLLGLDKSGKMVDPLTEGWFGKMTDEELVEKARLMGVSVDFEIKE